MGIPKPDPVSRTATNDRPNYYTQANQGNNARRHQHNQQVYPEEKLVKINGITTSSDITKVRKWLQLYGELVTDITEDSHYDPDPDSAKVGNGIYSVKMKINKQIPYMTVKHVLF